MDGWTSVLVRTERGRLAFQQARAKLDVRGLDDPDALVRLDNLDKRIAVRSLQRKFDPDGPLFIDYEEHVRNYDGHRPPPGRDPPVTEPTVTAGPAPAPRRRSASTCPTSRSVTEPSGATPSSTATTSPTCVPRRTASRGWLWAAGGSSAGGPHRGSSFERSSPATGARSGCGWPATGRGSSAAPA